MIVVKAICKILILLLYIELLIRTHKERKHLDRDDPGSPVIDHLSNVETWLATLVTVISIYIE